MKSGFEVDIFGYKIFCCNLPFRGSNYFDSVINNYDAVCPYNYDGSSNTWQYSFYSTTIDTTKIGCEFKRTYQDKILSNGGHKGASGMVSTINVFEK